MSTHYYKRYLQVLSRWPRDMMKSKERDPKVFLENEVERLFRKQPELLPDNNLCARKLQCLEQIVSDASLKRYPHEYASGIFGLQLDRMREVNSEDGREAVELKPKKRFFSFLSWKKE